MVCLSETECLSLLQKKHQAVKHNTAVNCAAACTAHKEEAKLPELMPTAS